MLLNILQFSGKAPATKDYLESNINSAEIEKHYPTSKGYPKSFLIKLKSLKMIKLIGKKLNSLDFQNTLK